MKNIINKNKRNKKRIIFLVCSIFSITLIITILLLCLNLDKIKTIHDLGNIYDLSDINLFNKLSVDSIKVIKYDKEKKYITLEVKPNKEMVSCSVNGNDFLEMEDNICLIDTSIKDVHVYFKDKLGFISDEYLIDSYLIETSFKDSYYLAINGTYDINNSITLYGDINITYNIIDNSILSIKDNIIIGIAKGETDVSVMYNNEIVDNFKVIVTDVITTIPKNFNTKKSYLPCEKYTEEEAELLDKILEDRINDVGLNTRAGVVEAARFLMLEFPYRIKYFFENGRVDRSGVNYADGEGRYYHKGLYLSKTKEKSMQYTFAGPAMWGCPLMNYEDSGLFVSGRKYPNGLDCSGFVSWVLVNGGFDPGDLGAGNSEDDPRELSDLGEYKRLTSDLIYSNKVKVGDLLNIWGHIAILVGIDDNNYYVAESLDIYGGVVIKTYSKKTISQTFPYVVLMDSYYKEDGKITNMWY